MAPKLKNPIFHEFLMNSPIQPLVEAFTDIAVHASPELAHMPEQAFDVLCCEVLAPLGKRVLQNVASDLIGI